MTPKIDDDPIANDLPGQRSAGAARNQSDAMLVGEENQLAHIGLGPWQRDREGERLILRGVRRIERAHRVIMKKLAGETGGEVVEKGWSRGGVRGHNGDYCDLPLNSVTVMSTPTTGEGEDIAVL